MKRPKEGKTQNRLHTFITLYVMVHTQNVTYIMILMSQYEMIQKRYFIRAVSIRSLYKYKKIYYTVCVCACV